MIALASKKKHDKSLGQSPSLDASKNTKELKKNSVSDVFDL